MRDFETTSKSISPVASICPCWTPVKLYNSHFSLICAVCGAAVKFLSKPTAAKTIISVVSVLS